MFVPGTYVCIQVPLQSVAFLGSGVALLGLASAPTPLAAALFLTLALGCSAFSQAGFLVNFQVCIPYIYTIPTHLNLSILNVVEGDPC